MGDLNTLMYHLTRRMRAAGMEGFIPAIGEGYGMENALMLVMCQDPDNPGVKRSGELSFTNDEPSANMLRESFKYLDLDWGITVPWNAIPWTQMGEKDHDLDLVREWGIIPALLKPMKSLKVVVLLGKGYAWTLEKEIHSLCPDVEILTAPTRVTRVSFPSGVSPARSLSTGCVTSLRWPRSTRRRISGVGSSRAEFGPAPTRRQDVFL